MQFQKLLKHLIDTDQYRLVTLASSAKVHASDLSKVINGKRSCGSKMMRQIIAGLIAEDQAQALICWLKDQVPAEFAHLVHIVRAEPVKPSDKPLDVSTIEGSLAILSKQAESNEKVQHLLKSMAEMFAR
jgi:hypothetical protein